MAQTEEITKAVKEALTDHKLEDLKNQITGLQKEMTEGFTAVKTRQDYTNGKVMSHELKFKEQEGKNNYTNVLWLLVTTLVGIVATFATYFFTS